MYVGDDVVDLGDPETRDGARHPGFDARVFTADELRWLQAQPDTQLARWTLWAAKESALKLARKLEPDTVFSPRAFSAQHERPGLLQVTHGTATVEVEVRRSGSCLHALAHSHGSAVTTTVVSGHLPPSVGANPSDAVRRFACEQLAAQLACEPAELLVVKTHGVPQLERNGEPLAADLSLSHHGRFVSFACALTDRSDCLLLAGTAMLPTATQVHGLPA
jgi:phosphopantetheinyl transferase (holo-ACP synthase)